jgi:hypothetical protein
MFDLLNNRSSYFRLTAEDREYKSRAKVFGPFRAAPDK